VKSKLAIIELSIDRIRVGTYKINTDEVIKGQTG